MLCILNPPNRIQCTWRKQTCPTVVLLEFTFLYSLCSGIWDVTDSNWMTENIFRACLYYMEVTPYIYYIYDARRKEYGFQREMKGRKKGQFTNSAGHVVLERQNRWKLVLLVSETLRTDYLNGTSMYRTPDSPWRIFSLKLRACLVWWLSCHTLSNFMPKVSSSIRTTSLSQSVAS
jgi:hypothetical protein